MSHDNLVLKRVKDEVFFESRKLTIVKQETKGVGNEVVKIEGLPNSNGQKWVSLSKLNEGLNSLVCKKREVTSPTRNYVLTPQEASDVKRLQSQIDEIIEVAKSRYVAKPNLNVDPSKMTLEERQAKYEELKKYFNL